MHPVVNLSNSGSIHCGCEGRSLSGSPCRSQSRRNRMTVVVVLLFVFAASSSQPHAGVSFQCGLRPLLPSLWGRVTGLHVTLAGVLESEGWASHWPRVTGELSIEEVFRQAAILHAPYMAQPAQASLASRQYCLDCVTQCVCVTVTVMYRL